MSETSNPYIQTATDTDTISRAELIRNMEDAGLDQLANSGVRPASYQVSTFGGAGNVEIHHIIPRDALNNHLRNLENIANDAGGSFTYDVNNGDNLIPLPKTPEVQQQASAGFFL